MEIEGLQKSIKDFSDAGIEIRKLITDRRVQIRKWVRENMDTTKHWVDTWHVAKGRHLKYLSSENQTT